MTIAVDLGCKATKQTNKQIYTRWPPLADEEDQDSSQERGEHDIRFITPGGRKITMSNARRKCKDTSTEFAGWNAVRSNDMHLNTPSWVDVSRYVISNIRNHGKSCRTLSSQNAACWVYVSRYVISNIKKMGILEER